MILSKNAFESYEAIKHKQGETKLTDKERLLLNEVYSEITGKPINKGCDACLLTVWQIVHNWYKLFYKATELTHKTKEVVNEIKGVIKRKRKPKV